MFHDQLNPKCANPACSVAFDWMAGGKCFRFHPISQAPLAGDLETLPSENASAGEPVAGVPSNAHGVKHYWLCERCARIYTLAYSQESGVLVRPLLAELAAAPNQKDLVSA